MNRGRRSSLKEATSLLDRAISLISDARDEEQDCLDNLPENLQNSERYESMEMRSTIWRTPWIRLTRQRKVSAKLLRNER